MSDWPKVAVRDWDHFTEMVNKIDMGRPSKAGVLFRGQADTGWTLKPSLIRDLGNVTAEQIIGMEQAATKEFRSQAHLHVPSSLIPDRRDILSCWMLMQHYGAPTRILDWTLSPYVAAYFAVVTHPSKPGAIWLFDAPSFEKAMHEQTEAPQFSSIPAKDHIKFFSKTENWLYMVERLTKSDRDFAQQSQNTISTNVLIDHADIIPSVFEKDEATRLLKLVIEPKLKAGFLLRLRTMNVSANSLFPGIDGLGRSVRELVRLESSLASLEGAD